MPRSPGCRRRLSADCTCHAHVGQTIAPAPRLSELRVLDTCARRAGRRLAYAKGGERARFSRAHREPERAGAPSARQTYRQSAPLGRSASCGTCRAAAALCHGEGTPPGRRARALRSVACASRPRWQCAGHAGSASCGSTSWPIPCQDAATGQHKVRGGSVMVTDGAGPSYMAAQVVPGGRLLLSGYATGNPAAKEVGKSKSEGEKNGDFP